MQGTSCLPRSCATGYRDLLAYLMRFWHTALSHVRLAAALLMG